MDALCVIVSAVSFLKAGALLVPKLSIPSPVPGIIIECSLTFLSCLFPVIFLSLIVYHISFHNHGSLNVKDKQILNNITKQCSKITGKGMVNLTELYRKSVISKAFKIEQDPSHCLHMVLEWLPSKKKRMRAIRCTTNRFKNTFFPTAIRFINENNSD